MGANMVEQCERIGEQGRLSRHAAAGAVTAVRHQIHAAGRKPRREFVTHPFDPLGIAAKVEDRPGLSRIHYPAPQGHPVTANLEVGVSRINAGVLREVDEVALLGVHPGAQAGVPRRDHDDQDRQRPA